MQDLLQKRKEIKNPLFDSTLYDRHNPVQVCDLYGMTRYESLGRIHKNEQLLDLARTGLLLETSQL